MLYTEYVLRKAESVVPIDAKVPPENAAVLELFGCAHHCLTICGDLTGRKVGLSGLGPAGLAILQIARLRTPREIVGIEIDETRREAARSMGLEEVYDPQKPEELDALKAGGIDLVIDATGVPRAILNAFEITTKEVVIFGFTNERFEVDQSKWFHKELVIRNSKVQTIEELRAVVKLQEEEEIAPGRFLGGVMSFEEYDKALEKVYKKEAVKILLTWK